MKNNNKNSNRLFNFAILGLMMLALASCTVAPGNKTKTNDYVDTTTPQISPNTQLEASQTLKKFSSAKEIIEFLEKSSSNSAFSNSNSLRRASASGGIAMEFAMADSAPSAAPVGKSSSDQSTDFSTTNVQVEGVDEADFVKNDGKYVYIISQDNLVIVDGYPAEDAKIVSTTKLDGRPRDMFVNKDRLVVFEEKDGQVLAIPEYDFLPQPRYVSKTHVVVYDISERSNPKKIKDYNLVGNYFQSRMIGNHVYFIVQEGVYYYQRWVDLPVIMEGSDQIVKPDVYYFDNPEQNYNFNTVASFDIFEENKINAKTFMMGWTNTIYVSENNLYIAYQKSYPYYYYDTYNEDKFFKVIVPLLPSDAQSRINSFKDDKTLNQYEKWSKISPIMEEMYNRMEKKEKNEILDKIAEAVSEYEMNRESERRKTVIHKIKIDNGNIDYGSRGEVPGYLLNQFSLDEHEGNLRVATTMEFWNSRPMPMMATSEAKIAVMPPRQNENVVYNNVYVLNSKMETIGKLENLAEKERIYSTRFIGDRLYMVTFLRIDPLFVIDLSNPNKPEVLGELKIPGFSDYLHPYDENHIIGIGKETGTNDWGGVSTKGVKVALFDVSDVKNPKQVDSYEIGQAGTDSEALRDHKAFLFDKEKNVLVIPVTEVKSKQVYDSRYGYYRQRLWQGAYVFGFNDKKEIELKGKISHNDGDEQSNYWYYGSPNAVRRSLYIDDVLYTVSQVKVQMNDLKEISKEINSVDIPYEKEKYYRYYWY